MAGGPWGHSKSSQTQPAISCTSKMGLSGLTVTGSVLVHPSTQRDSQAIDIAVTHLPKPKSRASKQHFYDSLPTRSITRKCYSSICKDTSQVDEGKVAQWSSAEFQVMERWSGSVRPNRAIGAADACPVSQGESSIMHECPHL